MAACPICANASSSINPLNIDCPRCGHVVPTGNGAAALIHLLPQALGNWDAISVQRRSRLSHLLRRMQRGGQWVGLALDDLERWHLDDPLPSPAEQLENLVLWVGDHEPDPALPVKIPDLEVRKVDAWIGGKITLNHINAGLGWLLEQEETRTLVERTQVTNGMGLRLTMKGWERYYSLKRGRNDSRKAFMAMKYNDPAVETAYNTCFKPAVAKAGFELFDLRDQQSAGMIDDQMRVAIRNSRFVIADLSNGCRGSYWEGGFAEGLGRPVVYTCEAGKWNAEGSHFDTNHLTTVIWEAGKFEEAVRQLAAIIRNTLPDEAQME